MTGIGPPPSRSRHGYGGRDHRPTISPTCVESASVVYHIVLLQMHLLQFLVRDRILEDHVRPSSVVNHSAIHAVDVTDKILGDDVFGRTDLVYYPRSGHHHDLVRKPARHVQVVTDHDHGYALLVGQLLHEFRHLYLVSDIQISGRFIQYQYVRVLCQTPGQGHLLMLSCRKFVVVAKCQMGDVLTGDILLVWLTPKIRNESRT